MTDTKKLAELFCAWTLPKSVCADLCATKQQDGRSGTNLLSVSEAKQFFDYLVEKGHIGPSEAAPQPADVAEAVKAAREYLSTQSKPCDGCSFPVLPDVHVETLIQAEQGNAWQPIDTCQKEKGKPIIMLDVEGVTDIGWWNGDFKNRDGYIIEPTHWMPLSPLPTS